MKTEKDLEDLKKKINKLFPDFKQLFTLTPEEVEILEMDILPDSIEEYETHGKWSLYKLEFCKKLINRIKKFQDEKYNQDKQRNNTDYTY